MKNKKPIVKIIIFHSNVFIISKHMFLKDLLITILLILCAIYFVKYAIRLIKDIVRLFSSSRSYVVDTMHTGLILQKQLFATMNKEQRYAYLYTLKTFLTLADNVQYKNKDEAEKAKLQKQIAEVYVEDSLKLLGINHNDMDNAIEFFDTNFLLRPQDFLKQIENRKILDSLLFYCSKIADTKEGNFGDKNIKKLAKDFLYDLFGELGYTPENIEDKLLEISRY